MLHQTGCTGRCSREPIVGVMVPGQMPVKYERVDRPLVHAIFTQHVQQGQPVLEHVLDGQIETLPDEHLKAADKTVGESSWNPMATWPSSIARAAWPCGTTA